MATQSFKASALVKTLVTNPPPLPPLQGVAFGSLFTPHMLIVEYANGAWGVPRIEPFRNLSLPPQTACLHYGMTCFEGMKAYADVDDIKHANAAATAEATTAAATTAHRPHHIRLFRPEMNVARLARSMERLCFPAFDEHEMLALIEEFVKTEAAYVPKQHGFSLYLRPNAIGMSSNLGVAPCNGVCLYIIASPVGPYYQTASVDADPTAALKPVKLLVEETHRRAWPGGTGSFKLGANYAGTLYVQRIGQAAGYNQVLWLGAHGEVQEVGAMNFCVLWRRKEDSALELITAPLDGTILPGVTRDSVLELARQWGEFAVSERPYQVEELVEALQEKRVVECFGCGTAAIVSPVNALSYRGTEYAVPCPTDGSSVTRRVMRAILDIQYGVTKSAWSRLLVC